MMASSIIKVRCDTGENPNFLLGIRLEKRTKVGRGFLLIQKRAVRQLLPENVSYEGLPSFETISAWHRGCENAINLLFIIIIFSKLATNNGSFGNKL